jgi:hypothetical protein
MAAIRPVRSSSRPRGILPIAPLLLVALLVFSFSAPKIGANPPPAVARPVSPALHLGANHQLRRANSPFATTDDISIAGYDPTTVALSWSQSGDLCFDSYDLQEATYSDNGPWTTIATITDSGITSEYISGFGPGQTVWFQDIDNSGCGGGSATSNVVSITFPNWPHLSYSDTGSSTVELSWTNTADYGGLMGFYSYQVYEQVNSGGFSSIDTITSVSTTTYSVTGITGLDTGTHYSFYIQITDYCNGCSQSESYTAVYASTNTIVHLNIDQPVATPASLELGQTVQFSITVEGGQAPYSYDWSGLPAGCSSTDSNPLSCTPSAAGSSSVVVTVTDNFGSTLTSLPVTATVVAALTVGLPTASASSVAVGGTEVFTASVSGGTAPYTYVWSGLPTGCSSSDVSQLSCAPTATGTWSITVKVTDSSGTSQTSAPVSVTITAAGTGPGNGNSNTNSTGTISPLDLTLIVVIVVIAAGAVAVLAMRRGKKPGAPPSGPANPGPPAS